MNRQPTHITGLQVKNYRSLADIDISFGPLTVLVGPNGAGKSNLIDALRFIRDAMGQGLDKSLSDRGGIADIYCRAATEADIHFGIQITTIGQSNYTFTLNNTFPIQVKREWMNTLVGRHPGTWEIREGEIIQAPNWMKPNEDEGPMPDNVLYLRQRPFETSYMLLRSMLFYNIYPDLLRKPQKPGNPYPLDEQGRNLATVLNRLQQTQNHTSLEEALSKVVPEITAYSIEPVGGYLVTRLHHTSNTPKTQNQTFELAYESDGTLRMLGILTALYQDPPPPLIVIEEPELTIHPGALGLLKDVLQEASQRSQIIITTHSPDLIAEFPVDTLRVVEKDEGVTKVGPLAKNQKEAITEMLFSPGELMRIEGLRRETNEHVGE